MAWRDERELETGHHGSGDALSTLLVVCAALGLLLGFLAASGAFFYDGNGRVNVLLLLGLFAALPAATLALFALACVSGHGLRAINPGRLGAVAGRLLPGDGARELARIAAGSRGPDVAKWLLLTCAQWMGLGFGFGAVAAALMLVVFTDLAFGWTTTLDVHPSSLHGVVHGLALPWRELAPGAVPSADLVESTRYFRLAGEAPVSDPARLGRWWPFVIMAMLVYGVAPRLFTTPFAHWRLARACARALVTDRKVRELLQRMTTPLVETRSLDTETTRAAGPHGVVFASLPRAAAWTVVNWAAVPVDREALAHLLNPARLLQVCEAGGSRSTADDRTLIGALVATPADAGVLVIARGFDPPTLDLMDFLQALREAVPGTRPVAILPLAVADAAPAPLDPGHAAVWANTLARQPMDGLHAVALQRREAT